MGINEQEEKYRFIHHFILLEFRSNCKKSNRWFWFIPKKRGLCHSMRYVSRRKFWKIRCDNVEAPQHARQHAVCIISWKTSLVFLSLQCLHRRKFYCYTDVSMHMQLSSEERQRIARENGILGLEKSQFQWGALVTKHFRVVCCWHRKKRKFSSNN